MKNCLIRLPVSSLLRTVLWAALGMVCFAATLGTSSTWAQSDCFIDKNGTRACPVGPEPGGGSGNTSSTPSGPSPEEVRQQRERQRLKAKEWSSDEALDYFDRKDWDNAIRSFEEALDRDPDDPDLDNWLKRAKAEKAKARMPAVTAPSRPAPSNDSKVVDTRNEPTGLGGKSNFTGAAAKPGQTKPAPTPAPHTDTSVVDARKTPSGLPKSVDDAIPHSPSGDRVRKGFQSIQASDWKAALAWFQDALNHEPGSPGLQRLVDLAQFTLQRRSESVSKAKDDASEVARKQTKGITKSGMSKKLARSLNDYYSGHTPDFHKESAPELHKWVNSDGTVVYVTKADFDWLSAPEPNHAWKQFFRLFAPAFKVRTDGTSMYTGIRG